MYRKNTKIICTVSDRNCSPDFIRALYESGMNVVRINTAHVTPESAGEIVRNVRSVSEKIGILIDTKGPEVRLTATVPASGIPLRGGDTVRIGKGTADSTAECLYTNCPRFAENLQAGSTVLIDDGEIALKVLESGPEGALCRVEGDALVKSRKSVNVPGLHIDLPSVSGRDAEFIRWAARNRIDFIAHSFVRNAADLQAVREILEEEKSDIWIIAKIENQEGVDRIDEIIRHCDGIMVARGDLGVEIAAERIPVIQRDIVRRCRQARKPVIIATQMLHTMIEHPRPTRAEVSDVANAVYQSADAIMLSGETANGKYPVEAVRTMSRIAEEIEKQMHPDYGIRLENPREPVIATLAESLVRATERLPVKALVIDTHRGRTARYLAFFRPETPVFAECYNPGIVGRLALIYGIYPFRMERQASKDAFVKTSIGSLLDNRCIRRQDLIGILGGNFGSSRRATFLEIDTAEKLLL